MNVKILWVMSFVYFLIACLFMLTGDKLACWATCSSILVINSIATATKSTKEN